MSQDRKTMSNVPNLRFPGFIGEWEEKKLGKVAKQINDRVSSARLTKTNYISTENLLADFQGIVQATSIPSDVNVIAFKPQDVLLSNIRPYLKKVWLSNIDGGCSADVFVFRSEEICSPVFLYYSIANDQFIDYVMIGAKGVKMPRGDKHHMQQYPLYLPKKQEQNKIASFISLLDQRISTQNKIIEDLKLLKNTIRKKIYEDVKKSCSEYAQIKDLIEYEQPTNYIVDSTNYSKNNSLLPVLTANKAFILGYTNEQHEIYDKGDCIIFDDFTMDLKYVDFPFKVKSSAIKILKSKAGVNLRYVFEYLSYWDYPKFCVNVQLQDSGSILGFCFQI